MAWAALGWSAGGRGPPEAAAPRAILLVMGLLAAAFVVAGAQIVRLALASHGAGRLHMSEPVVRSYARPDIVDRNGRLFATDVDAHSLFADPTLVIDVDEAVEKLNGVLAGLDLEALRTTLGDTSRRFVWVRRGLTPALSQAVHDLGIPGLAFRREPRRVYPNGRLAGHVLGGVDRDNRGLSGLERHIDERLGLETFVGPGDARRAFVLSLDLGVQHGLERELAGARERHRAAAAIGLVLDVATGEIMAAAAEPGIDPAQAVPAGTPGRVDPLHRAGHEASTLIEIATVAMALDYGLVTVDTVLDARERLAAGGPPVLDQLPLGRAMTVREILVLSSRAGAARLALAAGPDIQRAFLARAGLTRELRTEVGWSAAPRLPVPWGEAEVAAVGSGSAIAVSPLQLASALAALVNGGGRIAPTFVPRPWHSASRALPAEQVINAETSLAIRELLRSAVSDPAGSGRHAEVAGFEVGGRAAVARPAGAGSAAQPRLVSFLAVFPATAPRYLVLVSLAEPQARPAARDQALEAAAATLAAAVIARAAPLLGVRPAM